jgi:hypothetical protein
MKKIATILILLFLSFGLTAQNNVPIPKSLLAGTKSSQKGPDTTNRKLKFIVGGNIGFQVAGNVLDMQISPHIGILPGVDFLCFGIGGTYQLTYYKNPISGIKTLQHIVGGNVFVEGYVWQRLILHAEYEVLSFPVNYPFVGDPLFKGVHERPSAHGILLGPGYKQDIGTDLSVYTVFLFSVYDPQNVRGIMDIRVGVNYKF